MKTNNIIRHLLGLTALLLMASCSSYKKVPYLQDPEVVNNYAKEIKLYDAKIMPKDLITISVSTSDPAAAAPFNLTVQGNASSQGGLQQYLVDNEGCIDFPVIGKLQIGGMTKSEVESLVREKLTVYLKEQPIVNVRMTNYKISVLGEVNGPGVFNVTNEKVNVLEALSMAGDLTIYGMRTNVKLIREDENGQPHIIPLDLTRADLVLSPYFYLKQNDILYVTPNKVKAKSSDIGTSTSFWLGTVSMMMSVVSMLVAIIRH